MITPSSFVARWRRLHGAAWILALVLLSLPGGSASAQGTGSSLQIDPSVISSGMGNASTAVFWTGEPNYWANPALLGYYRGLRWQYGKTQLVPGLASDVFFTTSRMTAGVPGLAVAMAGKPNHLGGLDLDIGAGQGTDENGNPVGSFGGHESIDSWSAGVSAMKLIDGVAALFGATLPQVARYFDFAVGASEKDFEIVLAPNVSGTGTARDEGYLVRGGIGTDVLDMDGPPVRLDASYGYSIRNANDVLVYFTGESIGVPVTRTHSKGVSARLSMGVTRDMRRSSNGVLHWLAQGAEHAIALGYAYDRNFVSAGGGPTDYETEHHGVELDLMNVIALRYGHYTDRLGDIDGDSWGVGVTARWSSIAGVRYDFGTQPQARDSGLEDLQRHEFSVFFDPFALSRRLR